MKRGGEVGPVVVRGAADEQLRDRGGVTANSVGANEQFADEFREAVGAESRIVFGVAFVLVN